MKSIPFLSLFVLLTPLVAQNETKHAAGKPKAEQQALLPNQQAFLNLPEESRKEFAKHLVEASRTFQQKRIFETMEELDKATAVFKESPEIHNLRGSCYVEMRAFDKAMAEFNKAAALSKDNPSIEFNIGEVNFVTKQWQKAYDIFQKVLKLVPAENTSLSRLIEFKILLCMKKLGKDNDAIILAEKYDFLDDSPFYYFAQATLAYEKKDMVKAEEWLARANRIFRDPNILAPWQDTLVEYGYIKSFYGDDSSPEE
jgi:tetratricopeptide (TPR) repeat protein